MAEKLPGNPAAVAAFREHLNKWKKDRALGETNLDFEPWLKITAPTEYPKWLKITGKGK